MLVSARNGHEAVVVEKNALPPNCQEPPQGARTSRQAAAPQDRSTRYAQNDARAHHIPEISFRHAEKRNAKVRLALAGPGGSGKTYTLLTLATELGGPIAVIDTEHGSASKYADIFRFDVLELARFSPEIIPSAIDIAAKQGYHTLLIDSLSHFWTGPDGELDQVEQAKLRMRDNGWAAWRFVTPKHNRMVDAILQAPLHILVSMRSKTEWIVEQDATGKSKPKKVGLAPVMREGIEYEFDVCGDMDQENTLQITKTRCPTLAGGIFPKPGKELADVLKSWLGAELLEVRQQEPDAGSETSVEPKSSQPADRPEMQPAAALSQELVSIYKRMCSPRGVVNEFTKLKSAAEELAGSTGVAEYHRILRQHGVNGPKGFRASQPARVCAKEVFALVEELRRNAQANQCDMPLGVDGERSLFETAGVQQEAK